MTAIIRDGNTVYFDKIILEANIHGGGFRETDKFKLHRHRIYPALIGCSGAISGEIYGKLMAIVEQTLTNIAEDPTAGLSREHLVDLPKEALFSMIIILKDRTITINADEDKRRVWNTFTHSADVLAYIGCGNHLHRLTNKHLERVRSNEGILEFVTANNGLVSANWCAVDISKLKSMGDSK